MRLNVSCNQVAYRSYNMGTRRLPDIYTLALGHWVYVLGKALLPML